MKQFHQSSVSRSFTAATLFLLVCTSPLWADLEYCVGLDALVADSPLIVTARVNSVKIGKTGGKSSVTPSRAEIAILEILKGEYKQRKLSVGSGPILASASYPVHYSFKKDQQYVFVLPSKPERGKVNLKWGGSLLRIGKASIVRTRLRRGEAYKHTYLEKLLAESPLTYERGLTLSNAFSGLYPSWPSGEEIPRTGVNDKKIRPHMAKITYLLSGRTVDDLYAAYAVSWFAPGVSDWTTSPVWKLALQRYEKYFKNDILVFNREQIGKVLKHAGIGVRLARAYIKSIPASELEVFKPFPFDAPESFLHKRTGEILTTELIFQFHCYDQVGMYTDYLKDFDLSSLNPGRIQFMIPYLFSSGIKELGVLGNKIIREVPGNHFTAFVYKEQMSGNTDAWISLKNWNKPELTEQRMRYLLSLGGKEPYFWKTLIKGDCFERSAIKHSISLLEELEQTKSKEFKGWKEEGKGSLRKALSRYLNTARSSMSPEVLSLPEYREWYEKKVR